MKALLISLLVLGPTGFVLTFGGKALTSGNGQALIVGAAAADAGRYCGDILNTATHFGAAGWGWFNSVAWSDGGIITAVYPDGPGVPGSNCVRSAINDAGVCGEALTSAHIRISGSEFYSLGFTDTAGVLNGETYRVSYWLKLGGTDAGRWGPGPYPYKQNNGGPAAPTQLTGFGSTPNSVEWIYVSAETTLVWSGTYTRWLWGQFNEGTPAYEWDVLIAEVNIRVADGGSGITDSCSN